jgi:hypothetical protein
MELEGIRWTGPAVQDEEANTSHVYEVFGQLKTLTDPFVTARLTDLPVVDASTARSGEGPREW